MAESLFQRIAAGDELAVRKCLDVHGGRVWALARRFSADHAEAEDAVQEIFISLWKSAHRYDPEKASEAAFVATIARRRLIDRLRARGARAETVQIDEERDEKKEEAGTGGGDPASRMEAALDLVRVRDVLDALEPEPRRVIELAVLQGCSHGQVAEATGIALGTVKSHVRRSLIRVRDALRSVGENGR